MTAATWFYAVGTQKVGPIAEEVFHQLIRTGQVTLAHVAVIVIILLQRRT